MLCKHVFLFVWDAKDYKTRIAEHNPIILVVEALSAI